MAQLTAIAVTKIKTGWVVSAPNLVCPLGLMKSGAFEGILMAMAIYAADISKDAEYPVVQELDKAVWPLDRAPCCSRCSGCGEMGEW